MQLATTITTSINSSTTPTSNTTSAPVCYTPGPMRIVHHQLGTLRTRLGIIRTRESNGYHIAIQCIVSNPSSKPSSPQSVASPKTSKMKKMSGFISNQRLENIVHAVFKPHPPRPPPSSPSPAMGSHHHHHHPHQCGTSYCHWMRMRSWGIKGMMLLMVILTNIGISTATSIFHHYLTPVTLPNHFVYRHRFVYRDLQSWVFMRPILFILS